MSNPFSAFTTAKTSLNIPANPFAFASSLGPANEPAPIEEKKPSVPEVKAANPFAAFQNTKLEVAPIVPTKSIDTSALLAQANTGEVKFSFDLFDDELRTIEMQKKREEIEEQIRMQNAIKDAVKTNSYIALPSQSEQSKALAQYVTDYKSAGKKVQQHKKLSKKNQRAARVAESKLEQLEARLSNTGSYRKSLQNQKKKQRKNLDW